jgi:hypothetical protein
MVPTSAPTSWTDEVIADVAVPIPWQSTAAPRDAEVEAEAVAGADADAAPELDAALVAEGAAWTDEGDEVVPDAQAPINRATKPSVAIMVVTLTVATSFPGAQLSGSTRRRPQELAFEGPGKSAVMTTSTSRTTMTPAGGQVNTRAQILCPRTTDPHSDCCPPPMVRPLPGPVIGSPIRFSFRIVV